MNDLHKFKKDIKEIYFQELMGIAPLSLPFDPDEKIFGCDGHLCREDSLA